MTVNSKIYDHKIEETSKELTVKEIVDKIAASKQMVHVVLNQLMEERLWRSWSRPENGLPATLDMAGPKQSRLLNLKSLEKG